jgi:hypothetical protein
MFIIAALIVNVVVAVMVMGMSGKLDELSRSVNRLARQVEAMNAGNIASPPSKPE